jgi:signal transduction histidine kinase
MSRVDVQSSTRTASASPAWLHAGWQHLGVAIGASRAAPNVTQTLDGNLTALVRIALGVLMLFVAAVEPLEDAALNPLIVWLILAHIAYASVAYALAAAPASRSAGHALHYRVDAVVFVALIAMTGGSDDAVSYFAILLFLFAAMTASVGWGVGAGLRLTALTAGLFCAAMVWHLGTSEVEWSHAFLHLIYICALGVVAARWSGHHFTLHRRLALLRDAGTLSNPRFGADHTIATLLERLRRFYDANVCLLVVKNSETNGWRVRHSDREGSRDPVHEEPLSDELREALPALDEDTIAISVRRLPFQFWFPRMRVWADDGRKDEGWARDRLAFCSGAIEELLTRFGGRSWLTVPVYTGQRWAGRLHLVTGQTLNESDARFVGQVISNSMLVIENIRLLDQLASSAAHRERLRLARDLHDSVIQPFIGVQLALVAVQRALRSGDLVMAEDEVGRLLGLTTATIDDLRTGVSGLKTEPDLREGLAPALRRYAAKFAEATGIAVEVSCEGASRLGDRLGAELFQVVVEGLSNVRRHTSAARAAVRLLVDTDRATVQIEDHSRRKPAEFTPQSIRERASALGGRMSVDRRRDGRTVVEVTIPL